MAKASKATMRDISRMTGLSVFGVSRALSGGTGVSESSREQVLKAADKLGYVLNRTAQQLRRATRNSVAVITASTSNSYYLDLMAGIQPTLDPSSWTVVVGDVAVNGAYDAELEGRMVRRLIEARVAGVISTLTLQPENTKLLARWDIPVIFVDSAPPAEASDFPSITTDNYNASLLVGEHLAMHNYKDWLFLAYPAKWSTRRERERGIRESAKLHGANLTVLETENDAESACRTLGVFLEAAKAHPRVLIAGNNPLLLGALKYLRDAKIAIPQDIAIVAYDEFAWSDLVDPPITLLNEHSERIGQLAATTLKMIVEKQIEAEKQGRAPTPIYLPEYQQRVAAQLTVRCSCGCTSGCNTGQAEKSHANQSRKIQ